MTPFAWSQPHDVNEHVAGIAAALRGRGHDVTVLAPSTRAADLRAGRHALLERRSPDVIAVGPAVPISRRSQMGVPVGVRANLSLALAQGALRRRPRVRAGPAVAVVPRAARHERARGRHLLLGRPARVPARADAARAAAHPARRADRALGARSARRRRSGSPATTGCSRRGSTRPCSSRCRSARRSWSSCRPNERVVARGVVRALRELPGWEVVLLRTKPLIARPAIPRDLAGRVRVRTARNGAARAALLNEAAVFVPGVHGLPRVLLEAKAAGCAIAAPPGSRSSRSSRSPPPRGSRRTRRSGRAPARRRARRPTGSRSTRSRPSSRRSTPGSARGSAHAGRTPRTRSRTATGSSPTCTCTPRGRSTARSTRPSSSTTPRPRGSARSRSPTTTSSAARSRPPNSRATATSS